MKILKSVDSVVKSIECQGTTFNYDYGLHSSEGPLTLKEAFEKNFRGYFYNSFFEKLNFDPKVYRVFIDSVDILEVVPKMQNTNKLLFECVPCNAVAKLNFKNTDFYFPYTANADYFTISEKYDISYDEVDGYQRKIYISKEGKDSGLLLVENGKRKKPMRLSVITEGGSTAEIRRVLENVRMNSKKYIK